MITFLAYYPRAKDESDGMMQRILNVDKLFHEHSRQYIDISVRRNSKKKCDVLSDSLTVYRVNLFLHLGFIAKLLKQSAIVYAHSIYNLFFPLAFLFFFRKKQRVYLDVHGVVPEENLLMGKKISYYVYSIVEYFAFRLIAGAIYVTNAMKTHYDSKYPRLSNVPSIVYNIYPNFAANFNLSEQAEANKTVVVYSGNCQKWQNIELMLDVIKKNRHEHLEYIILTGELSTFKKKLQEAGIEEKLWNISVMNVKPSELPTYYSKAHYGFILRDDIVVNQVANPTKMLEYLSFGIIPIVKSPQIGDFTFYSYDYLLYTDFQAELKPQKSSNNIAIAKKIMNSKENLLAFVLENKL
jgi:hypothetical protein